MAGHMPVMGSEAVDALVANPAGLFIDCTYGRGGHSERILNRLTSPGRLLVIDKDITAISHAEQNFGKDPRVTIIHGSYSGIRQHAIDAGMPGVDGILIDLGVSSPQLDDARRGFSFSNTGPLDMRMNQTRGETASEWLMRATESDIRHIIRKYGEEKFAKLIARRIVAVRDKMVIATTAELADLIEQAVPFKQPGKHPATRTFQAIRMYINRELEDLEACLADVVSLLVGGGRFVAISFHSLEDRLIKRFIRNKARGELLPSRLPVRDDQIKRDFKIPARAIKPDSAEVARNRRARSAILRMAERLPHDG